MNYVGRFGSHRFSLHQERVHYTIKQFGNEPVRGTFMFSAVSFHYVRVSYMYILACRFFCMDYIWSGARRGENLQDRRLLPGLRGGARAEKEYSLCDQCDLSTPTHFAKSISEHASLIFQVNPVGGEKIDSSLCFRRWPWKGNYLEMYWFHTMAEWRLPKYPCVCWAEWFIFVPKEIAIVYCYDLRTGLARVKTNN
jgi:hypothetical protein